MRPAADAAPSQLFVPGLAALGETFELPADEAHYLRRVVRSRAGDRVHATDGEGVRAELEVLDLAAAARVARLGLERLERPRALTMCCGAPEGERADWLIEKLGELGVAAFQPIDTERARWSASPQRRDRWRRLAIAALRQSRGAFLLAIGEPVPLPRLGIAAAPGARYLADPLGAPASQLTPGAGAASAVVGPSSGLSAAELKHLAELGFHGMRLATTRLRTETAALALAAWWSAA